MCLGNRRTPRSRQQESRISVPLLLAAAHAGLEMAEISCLRLPQRRPSRTRCQMPRQDWERIDSRVTEPGADVPIPSIPSMPSIPSIHVLGLFYGPLAGLGCLLLAPPSAEIVALAPSTCFLNRADCSQITEPLGAAPGRDLCHLGPAADLTGCDRTARRPSSAGTFRSSVPPYEVPDFNLLDS